MNTGTKAVERPRSGALQSSLYRCTVMHERRTPRPYRFTHGFFLFCLSLDELPLLDRTLRLVGRRRSALYRFCDADHWGGSETGTPAETRHALATWLGGQGVHLPPDARILLVTHLRVLGYVFNPVSFYFCLDGHGQPLCAVAEVGNTFGERKPYLLRPADLHPGGRFQRRIPKEFYVSPFLPLDTAFDFALSPPGERLDVAIDDYQGDTLVMRSLLQGSRMALTDANVARLTARYPLVTLRVITLIHWHAMKLWWRGTPWRRKAAEPELQRGVLNPEPTLRASRGAEPGLRAEGMLRP